jgi:large subunit ribosomal protein L17
MRHKVRSRTLGRLTGHRLAMLRNLATSLLEHKRIETTEMRAKEVSRYVESIIEEAKRAYKAKADGAADGGSSHTELVHKRNVLAKVYSRRDPDNAKRVARDRTVAVRLFDQYAKEFVEGAERKGGYTRITRLGNRKGDGAPVVLLELVGLS